MKNRYKWLIGAALLALVLGIAGYLYAFRTEKVNMNRLTTDFKVDASSLFKEFESNEPVATAKYQGKILEVSGAVESVEKNEWGNVTITYVDQMFGVTCTIDSLQVTAQSALIGTIKPGNPLTIKGRCDGMLTDVKIVKCIVIK